MIALFIMVVIIGFTTSYLLSCKSGKVPIWRPFDRFKNSCMDPFGAGLCGTLKASLVVWFFTMIMMISEFFGSKLPISIVTFLEEADKLLGL